MTLPLFLCREAETQAGPVRVISFEIPGGNTTPEEFAKAISGHRSLFIPSPGYGLILDGRGPIWGYAMMVHEGHPSAWIGVRDPRLGVVIVESHGPMATVGAVVPWPEEA